MLMPRHGPKLTQIFMFIMLVSVTALLGCNKDNITNPTPLPVPLFYDGHTNWSPDGEWIVFLRRFHPGADEGLYIIRPDGTDLTFIWALGENPEWSPDSKYLVSNSKTDRQLYLFNVALSEIDTITEDSMNKSYPSWHPSGEDIVYSVGVGQEDILGIWEHDLSTHISRRLFFARGFEPMWHPHERKILYLYRHTAISERDMDNAQTSELININRINASAFSSPSYNYDGTEVLFRSFHPDESSPVWVLQLESNRLDKIINNAYYPSWSPDGTMIAYTRSRTYGKYSDSTVYDGHIWILDLQTGEHRPLTRR